MVDMQPWKAVMSSRQAPQLMRTAIQLIGCSLSLKLLPIQLCHHLSCTHLVAPILPGPEARLAGPGTEQPARWCCWKRAGVDNTAVHYDVGP